MPPKKESNSSQGISSLVRDAGRKAKQVAETQVGLRPDLDPVAAHTFSVLDYIEQPWGLNRGSESDTPLWPAQRFIVKLYYHLPLDDKDRTIEVRDMFGSSVKYRFTEKEYLSYLYSEGRCNISEQDHARRELVLAIGRRAGKCTVGETLIPTEHGLVRLDTLGDPNGPEWQPIDVGIVQESGKSSRAKYFYNNGVADTFSIKSQSGYSITGTPHHRVMVLNSEGRVDWKPLEDVQIGDFIALNRSSNLWAKEYYDIQEYLPSIWPISPVVDEDLGHLLGLLTGDGTWSKGSYIECTGLEDQIKIVQESYRKVLNHSGRVFRVDPEDPENLAWRCRFDDTSLGIRGVGSSVRLTFHKLGWVIGCEIDRKRIPWVIFRSPKSVVCSFLRGLFETDGSAESGGRHITLSSASFDLIHEVQVLLLNMGIVSNISKKWSEDTQKYYANLSIKGVRSRKLFAELISFDSDRKRIPLEKALKVAKEGKSDTESIPFQYSLLRSLLESIPKRNARKGLPGWGRSHLRLVMGNTIKPSTNEDLTYPRLDKIIKVAEQLGADPDKIQHFRNLKDWDYFFDPVVGKIPGRHPVYDLTVPDGARFTANGLINHNTTLSSIFASYELYRILSLGNPQEYYGLPEGNRIQLISIATDKEQAGILFAEVTNHLKTCDFFKPFIANDTQQFVNIRTPHDIERYGPTRRNEVASSSLAGKASLRLTFKGSNGKGLRGFGNIVVIMDEMAHFIEDGGASAKEVYDAVTPSTAAYSPKQSGASVGEVESRIITISSPLNKAGKFYELYQQAMHGGDGAENMLAIQAPTWEVNPTVPTSYYRQKYKQDPAVFMVEHGAQFSDRVRGWIERESDLMDCVDPNLVPAERGIPRYPHQMGIDLGLVNDGTAIFITHVEGDLIVLDYYELWEAGKSWYESNPHLEEPIMHYAKSLPNVERLEFEEIANWIEAITKRFYIASGIFDRWNGIPLEQLLRKKGLTQFKSEFFTTDLASRMYQTTKMLMYDRKLRLFNYVLPKKQEIGDDGRPSKSPFIKELLQLEAEQKSKNLVVVRAPQLAGNHDDMGDAFVRSVWLSSELMANTKHASNGRMGRDPNAPPRTGPANAIVYQARRARAHGVFTERVAPRMGRGGGLRGFRGGGRGR